jgi:hypothetical protein
MADGKNQADLDLEGYRSITEEEKQPKFLDKAKKNPFFPIGIASGLTALGYSAYKFRTRGNTKLSLYLIHTRVAAQSAVVGTLTLGVLYNMYQEYVVNPRKQKK